MKINQKETKAIGHRAVHPTGETIFKKTTSSTLKGAIQLGITHTVGQLSKDPERDILLGDFEVSETIFFPAKGSNLTQSRCPCDFKFTTYAPMAFRYFRDTFEIVSSDYLHSLSNQPLRELPSPGASGSMFYVSSDDKFIIKTVRHKEAEFLQRLLPGYYSNLNRNRQTLLPKFYGLYCIQMGVKKIQFVVMNNLIPSGVQMHYKYDLKGSSCNRTASAKERTKVNPTYKDLDFITDMPDGLLLPANNYKGLCKSIQSDCLVLQSFDIIDYSLLVGVHNLGVGVQNKTVAKQDLMGGIPARNIKGERLLVFVGIIDILQSYTLAKKLEHCYKAVVYDRNTVSVSKPSFYSERFHSFMCKSVFRTITPENPTSKKGCREKVGRLTTTVNMPLNKWTIATKMPVASKQPSPLHVAFTAAGSERDVVQEEVPGIPENSGNDQEVQNEVAMRHQPSAKAKELLSVAAVMYVKHPTILVQDAPISVAGHGVCQENMPMAVVRPEPLEDDEINGQPDVQLKLPSAPDHRQEKNVKLSDVQINLPPASDCWGEKNVKPHEKKSVSAPDMEVKLLVASSGRMEPPCVELSPKHQEKEVQAGPSDMELKWPSVMKIKKFFEQVDPVRPRKKALPVPPHTTLPTSEDRPCVDQEKVDTMEPEPPGKPADHFVVTDRFKPLIERYVVTDRPEPSVESEPPVKPVASELEADTLPELDRHTDKNFQTGLMVRDKDKPASSSAMMVRDKDRPASSSDTSSTSSISNTSITQLICTPSAPTPSPNPPKPTAPSQTTHPPPQATPTPTTLTQTTHPPPPPPSIIRAQNNHSPALVGICPTLAMKKLNWIQIHSLDDRCMWVLTEKVPSITFNHQNMEQLFCFPASKHKDKGPTAPVKEITFVEPKKNFKLSIFLKHFKCSMDDFIAMIQNGDQGIFDVELLKQLLKLLPEKHEIENLKSFQGDEDRLAYVDRFYYSLLRIPCYRLRIECMLLCEETSEVQKMISPQVKLVEDACRSLRESILLPSFCRLTLNVGNFLNYGSHIGNAVAFKISSLPKLADTKANKSQITLLHHILEEAELAHPELLALKDDLEICDKAAEVDLKYSRAEAGILLKRLQDTAKEIANSVDGVVEQYTKAIEECLQVCWNLKERFSEIDRKRRDLAVYLCEDANQLSLQELFGTIKTFRRLFTRALRENKIRKERHTHVHVFPNRFCISEGWEMLGAVGTADCCGT